MPGSRCKFILLRTGFCAALLYAASGALISTVDAQTKPQEGDGSRQIVAEEFTRARPEKPKTSSSQSGPSSTSSTGSKQQRTGSSSAKARRRPAYKRVTRPQASAGASAPPLRNSSSASTAVTTTIPSSTAKVGITIWRLRPSRATDTGARILVMEDAKETQLTPERIDAETQLSVRDRVRLTIESPRVGYLYVVDREQYADGTLGDPYLIFPTSRTRGGDNRVQPGKLIDIPGQEDRPNYFTLVPSPTRQDQVAEILSIIVTTAPLEGLTLTDKAAKLSKLQVEKWEKQWGSRVEIYEMEGGAGQTWSVEEKQASATGSGARYLTQEDPSPQHIYLVEGQNNTGLLVTVPLRYRR